ncbi:MAG: rod shape-determining protein MreC [Acidobacteriaceae bacterium]
MESFFSRYRNALVLIVVLVAQLLALAVQAKRPQTDGTDRPTVSLMRYAVVSVITPPEKLFRNTGVWFRSVWYGYVDLIHVRRENASLQQQIERLRLEQASIAQDAAQGLRLQRMLGFQEKYIRKTLPAQVIGTSGSNQSQVVYIDKGSRDGLQQDMPVITADGIVGKVKDVFPHTSQVLLATDPTSGLGVILQNTRIRGILRGRAYGQLEVADISPDSRIAAGEPVVTSGGDQIFPRGLPVGTVEKVIADPEHDPLVDVLVRPAAKLSQLEEVLVITGTSDTMSSQEAKDLAASEAEVEAEQKRASDVLAERLPSRFDPNAPADTNPRQLVDAAGNPVKAPALPKPLHADRFSPGAEPDAAAMTPGGRWAAVKYGIEDKAAARSAAAPPRTAAGVSAKSGPLGNSGGAGSGTSGLRTSAPSSASAVVSAGKTRTAGQPGSQVVMDGPQGASRKVQAATAGRTPAATAVPKKPRVTAPEAVPIKSPIKSPDATPGATSGATSAQGIAPQGGTQ